LFLANNHQGKLIIPMSLMDFESETNIHSKWQALAVLPKAESIIIKFINKLLDLDTQYFYKRKVIKKKIKQLGHSTPTRPVHDTHGHGFL
jgi:hypothetical protein